MSLLAIPMELLTEILSYCGDHTNPITKKEYIALRLVCRLFNDIVSPKIFKVLKICSLECTLDQLQVYASALAVAQLVETYEYNAVYIGTNGSDDRFHQKHTRLLSLSPALLENAMLYRSLNLVGTANVEHEKFYYRFRDFKLSGKLKQYHEKYLPLLHNLKTVRLVITDNQHPFRYDDPHWCLLTFVGIIEGLASRMVDCSPIEELVIKGLDEPILQLTPRIVTKALTVMEGLRRVEFVIKATAVDTRWVLLVGHLLGAAQQLEVLKVSLLNFGQIKLWELLVPYDFVYGRNLEIRNFSAPLVRHWPRLRELTLCHMLFWSELLLSFLEKHKQTLRSVSISESQLIDGYRGCLKSLKINVPPAIPWSECQEPGKCSPWTSVFEKLKRILAPCTLNHLSFSRISHGPWPRRLPYSNFHDGEAMLWSNWIKRGGPAPPPSPEQLANARSHCPPDAQCCSRPQDPYDDTSPDTESENTISDDSEVAYATFDEMST